MSFSALKTLPLLLLAATLAVPSVLAQPYPDNDGRNGRGIGNCTFLRDSVLVYVVPSDTVLKAWKPEMLDTLEQITAEALRRLDSMAKSERVLLALSYEIARGPIHIIPSLPRPNLGHNDNDLWAIELWDSLSSARPRHQVAIIFAFNYIGPSYARTADNNENVLEKVFIYVASKPIVDVGIQRRATGFIHELLHLFGAMDLYYPKYKGTDPPYSRASYYVTEHFPNTLMYIIPCWPNCTLDPITLYLIGWKDSYPPELEFLFKED